MYGHARHQCNHTGGRSLFTTATTTTTCTTALLSLHMQAQVYHLPKPDPSRVASLLFVLQLSAFWVRHTCASNEAQPQIKS